MFREVQAKVNQPTLEWQLPLPPTLQAVGLFTAQKNVVGKLNDAINSPKILAI